MRSSGPIVELATQGEGPAWNMIGREGAWHLQRGGKQVWTRKMLAAVVDVFKTKMAAGRWPIGAPIGYNHAYFLGSLDPDATKSAGYVKDMEIRDAADGTAEVWALQDWTDEGRARVLAREFQGQSMEGVFSEDSPDFLGVSLTNHPANWGLAPMVAAEGETMEDPKIVAQAAQIEALTERLTAAEARAVKAEATVQEYRDREIATAAEALVSEGRFAATDAGRAAAKVMLASMDVEAVRAAIPAPVKATEPKRGEDLVHVASGLSGAGAGAFKAPKVALGSALPPAESIAQMRALREQQLRQIAAEQEV